MKTRTWIILLLTALIVCAACTLLFFRPGEIAQSAEIYSGGKLLKTVSLLQDQTFTVESPRGGFNTVSIQGGKIAVTEADCPDGYCMRRGYRNGGPSIICLPNTLEIRFLTTSEVDLPLG